MTEQERERAEIDEWLSKIPPTVLIVDEKDTVLKRYQLTDGKIVEKHFNEEDI